MRYHLIRKMDISNGPGVRVSIFLQGCAFKCKNCFNPETHDFKGGLEFNESVLERLLSLANYSHISGLSILGGEPLHPKNRETTALIARAFKERYPDKTVWVWTGFPYEDLKDVDFSNIDVLVDGRYVDELHDPTLMYKGSSNQRVIDIPKTLKKGCVVLYKEEVLV